MKRTRITPEDNYFGVFDGEVTYRFAVDNTEIKYMRYPDLSDVSLTSKCLAACPYCAIAGTMIATPKGSQPIESIKIGDVVFSGKNESNRVDQVHVRPYEGELICIHLEDGTTLELTPNHKVHTTIGETEAQFLNESHILLDL